MRGLTKLLGFIMAGGLFVVTISLTTDLLQQILPPKFWYLPALGTFAFDIGVIVWLMTLLYDVENGEQRTTAWILLVTDLAGVGTTAVCDVFFYDSTRGLIAAIPHDYIRWIVAALLIIIIVNVIAWIAMHVLHPEHIERATGRTGKAIAYQQIGSAPATTRVVESQPAQRQPAALPAPKGNPLAAIGKLLPQGKSNNELAQLRDEIRELKEEREQRRAPANDVFAGDGNTDELPITRPQTEEAANAPVPLASNGQTLKPLPRTKK